MLSVQIRNFEEKQMEVKVKKILFQNKENGYTVLRVTQDGDSSGKGGDETFNMTGIFFKSKRML